MGPGKTKGPNTAAEIRQGTHTQQELTRANKSWRGHRKKNCNQRDEQWYCSGAPMCRKRAGVPCGGEFACAGVVQTSKCSLLCQDLLPANNRDHGVLTCAQTSKQACYESVCQTKPGRRAQQVCRCREYTIPGWADRLARRSAVMVLWVGQDQQRWARRGGTQCTLVIMARRSSSAHSRP